MNPSHRSQLFTLLKPLPEAHPENIDQSEKYAQLRLKVDKLGMITSSVLSHSSAISKLENSVSDLSANFCRSRLEDSKRLKEIQNAQKVLMDEIDAQRGEMAVQMEKTDAQLEKIDEVLNLMRELVDLERRRSSDVVEEGRLSHHIYQVS
jgi:hypothetical protein